MRIGLPVAVVATFLCPVLALGLSRRAEPAARSASANTVTADAQECRHMVEAARCLFHEFYFTRAIYSSGGSDGFRGRRGSWATDFPEADQHFYMVMQRLAQHLDIGRTENPVRLDDPDLRRFPWLYAVEVGRMGLTEPEVKGLRGYLLSGGFLLVDDFWGEQQWWNFEQNIRAVLPEYTIVDLPMTHPVFKAYYNIDEFIQVPNIGNAQRGQTTECYGCLPQVKAIFDEHGRMMVMISFNSDLGDAWEWAEASYYPLKYSTYAFQLAVNAVIYGMSH